MQNQLLENLYTYKKTVALLAAFQLGLFRQIEERGYINKDKDIYHLLGWNERYTELLCIYLEKEGYLTEIDGGWQINKDFEKQLDAFEIICKHERSLYYKWLSPELLASSVQSTTDSRPFDKEGFTFEEQSIYNNALYGNNLNLIVFHLLRKAKREKLFHSRYLEYGRSSGRIVQAIKKHVLEISVDVVLLNQPIAEQTLYDVILIYNTIHYMNPEETKSVFLRLKKALNKGGFICIIDVFFKEDNVFQSTVLLDWITHGGVYNIYNHEVAEQLQSSGFTKVERLSIDSISTDLLFAYK